MTVFKPSRTFGPALLVLAVVLAACGGDDTAPAVAPTSPPEHKITVAGDSISVGLGAALRAEVPAGVEVVVIGVEGSGLARPDTFDWPERLERLAEEFPPEVLVFSLGSNDAQSLLDAQGLSVVTTDDQQAWDAEYSRRLAAAVDPFAETGTMVLWVGHVHTADPQVGQVNRRVHRLAQAVAADRDFMEAQDLAELLGSGEQVATACLVDDGLHLTVGCLSLAAEALAPDLSPN